MAMKYTEGESAPYTELQMMEEGSPPVMPKYKTFLMNFTQFGLNFMILLLSVEVVPAQVEKLVGGASKGRTLGGMVAGGAGVTFLVSPIVGMVSDRLNSRMGKRRPVILVGTLLLCFGLLGMAVSAPEINSTSSLGIPNKTHIAHTSHKEDSTRSTMEAAAFVSDDNNAEQELHCDVDLVARRCHYFQNTSKSTKTPPRYQTGSVSGHAHGAMLPRYNGEKEEHMESTSGNLGLYIVFFLLVLSSQATVAVPFNALVADISHPTQRGFNSGMMGAMILLGNVCGAITGISFTHIGVLSMYGIITAVLVVCVLITTFSITETLPKGRQEPPLSCKLVFVGFWEPLRDHDFRWVFITRFLMQQGVATITGFLEYWLNDMIPLPYCWSPETSVALLLLPLLFAAAGSSVIFGMISDKTGYRKAIITVASCLMGIGSFVNAFLSGEYAYFIAALMAFVIGLGFGAFQSVDFALVMDVLSEDGLDKAKDIAVWHQALVLPQALATPMGGIVLDLFQKVDCELGLGYIILFVMTSAYFILSGLLVYKIRRAR